MVQAAGRRHDLAPLGTDPAMALRAAAPLDLIAFFAVAPLSLLQSHYDVAISTAQLTASSLDGIAETPGDDSVQRIRAEALGSSPVFQFSQLY